MRVYTVFLSLMCGLFLFSAAVLFFLTLGQVLRRHRQRAAVYLGLTVLAGIVAAGFYFFRRLI